MKLNENTAISTSRVLLVPYDSRHVPTYHEWMKSPAIQEATASEPLTLEEEYENQQSWRASHDKLTFILCKPLSHYSLFGNVDGSEPRDTILAVDTVDGPKCMVGDINFFLYPDDEDDEEDGDAHHGKTSLQENVSPSKTSPSPPNSPKPRFCVGEVDIMIAAPSDRGKGTGRAAATAFLHYIQHNLDHILSEYDSSLTPPDKAAPRASGGEQQRGPLRLRHFMTKIGQANEPSIGLFKSLGFKQRGGVDYFGEVTLILPWEQDSERGSPEGYKEMKYIRPEE